MNRFTFLSFLMINSLNAFSQEIESNSYIYNIQNNIKVNYINNKENSVVENGVNICQITLTNLIRHGVWGAALNKISFIKGDGNDFNFGSVLTNTRLNSTFDNGSIIASNTYQNQHFYHIKYALKDYEEGAGQDYWLSNTYLSSITINFNNNPNIRGMYLSDLATCNPDCRGTNGPYNINLYSCDNNLIKTITIPSRRSSSPATPFYIDFVN